MAAVTGGQQPSYAGIVKQVAAGRCGMQYTGALGSGEKLAQRIRTRIYGRPRALRTVQLGIELSNNNVEQPSARNGFRARRVTVSSGGGGSGHAVGNVLTGPTANAETAFKVRVLAVSSGAVTKVALVDPGWYATLAADGAPQSATTGSGTGASFDIEWDQTGFLYREAVEPDFDNPVTTGKNAPRQVKRFLSDGTSTADVAIEPGRVSLSEPLSVAITQDGQAIALRRYVVGTGAPVGTLATAAEKYSRGSGTSDVTGGTSLLGGGGGGAICQPALILGRTTKPTTAVAIFGTSQEFSENVDTVGDGEGNYGYACRAVAACGFAYTQLAKSGDTVANIVGSQSGARLLLVNLGGFDVAYQGNNLVNDIGSGDSANSAMAKEATLVALIRAAGARYVIGNYSTPYTDSSDGWTTAGGQTLRSAGRGQYMIDRNAALDARTDPMGYDALFDNRSNDATAATSGIWQAGATGDGVHRLLAKELAAATAFFNFLRTLPLPRS